MNSSSEQVRPASRECNRRMSYPALEYPERDVAPDKTPTTMMPEIFSEGASKPNSLPTELQQFDPTAEFAARLEEQRRAITTQSQLEAAKQVELARAEISHAITQFTERKDEYFRQAEGEVVGLALAIARRIVHREVQIDPHLLAGLVRYELDRLDTATSVRLCVSPEDVNYWRNAAASMSQAVEVEADKSLGSDSVRIETDLGLTTLNFESELKEIERGFLDLLSRRPNAGESISARVQ